MHIAKIIQFSVVLLMVAISSVQASPFSWGGEINLPGANATLPLPEYGSSGRPASMCGPDLVITFSPVQGTSGGTQCTEQVQNGSLAEELLTGNQKFRDDVYNSSIERNLDLAAGQDPGVLWIGCPDSRSDPERITSAGPGEIFVTRNVGNIVPNHDWSMALPCWNTR